MEHLKVKRAVHNNDSGTTGIKRGYPGHTGMCGVYKEMKAIYSLYKYNFKTSPTQLPVPTGFQPWKPLLSSEKVLLNLSEPQL